MERDSEEGDKHKKSKQTAVDPDCLDLRETIAMNLIIDRLEVDDYIRFSAVCKKWQSIQNEHRVRYSPYPPLLPLLPLPLPWLSCLRSGYDKEANIVFHLPTKQKTYSIPLPKPYKRHFAFSYRHGWQILLLDRSVCIANPITGVQIELPPLPELFSRCHVLPISHSPSDPDCTVILVDYNGKGYLNHLNSNSWKKIHCRKLCRDTHSTVLCRNKIYCMTYYKRVWMIDTLLSDLVEQMIEMDGSEISAFSRRRFMLVDYFGELVLVNFIWEKSVASGSYNIKEFEVYKADFSRNKWVRLKTLGENALFLSLDSGFAISAVDVGCKKNTIYLAGCFVDPELSWRAFDLSTNDWIDGPVMLLHCNHPWHGVCSWFVPTLDYFGFDKRTGACQIQSR